MSITMDEDIKRWTARRPHQALGMETPAKASELAA